jgi:hypothetical protein
VRPSGISHSSNWRRRAVLETMARKVVAKDQADSICSPIDEEAAAWLVELAERRTWPVEAAAGMNRIVIKAREEED